MDQRFVLLPVGLLSFKANSDSTLFDAARIVGFLDAFMFFQTSAGIMRCLPCIIESWPRRDGGDCRDAHARVVARSRLHQRDDVFEPVAQLRRRRTHPRRAVQRAELKHLPHQYRPHQIGFLNLLSSALQYYVFFRALSRSSSFCASATASTTSLCLKLPLWACICL